MSLNYAKSLEAAIKYVEQLRSKGVKYLAVSRETLANLSSGPRKVNSEPQRTQSPSLTPVTSKAPPEANPVNPAPSASSSLFASEAPAKPIDAAAKAAAITDLRDRALVCQKCPHLVRSRKNVVFGVGDINSPLMFIGEAPGADEDIQGEPFVGKAGQLLTRIIQTMGFSRDTAYIANVLKCRPDTPGQTSGNRKPTLEEMKTCLPYLLAQIDLIKPKVIVALGATAMEGIFGRAVAITRERGRFQSFRDTPVMPTYHPSYLLRNQALSVKREVWEDMLQVLEKLNRPISDKQRSYFLKGT
ncbi:MAG: uracil-DNA glycosylase [Verrucomicrobia bacterium]|nr:uracil-DNA glycosylase [Verrucomicrobiota bacterium]